MFKGRPFSRRLLSKSSSSDGSYWYRPIATSSNSCCFKAMFLGTCCGCCCCCALISGDLLFIFSNGVAAASESHMKEATYNIKTICETYCFLLLNNDPILFTSSTTELSFDIMKVLTYGLYGMQEIDNQLILFLLLSICAPNQNCITKLKHNNKPSKHALIVSQLFNCANSARERKTEKSFALSIVTYGLVG